MNPESPEAAMQLAWLLATFPDEESRDGTLLLVSYGIVVPGVGGSNPLNHPFLAGAGGKSRKAVEKPTGLLAPFLLRRMTPGFPKAGIKKQKPGPWIQGPGFCFGFYYTATGNSISAAVWLMPRISYAVSTRTKFQPERNQPSAKLSHQRHSATTMAGI